MKVDGAVKGKGQQLSKSDDTGKKRLLFMKLGTPWTQTQVVPLRTYSVSTMGAPPVTTIVCSN